MRLQVLGSGTCLPARRRSSPSVALEVGEDLCLIDCGSGTLRRMTEAGLDYRRPRRLFFTHNHLDHTGDLAPLLFALKNTPDLSQDYGLHIIGPAGFKAYVNGIRSTHGPWFAELPFDVEITEVTSDTLSFGTWKMMVRPVRHGRSAIGFRAEAGNRTVAVSGDTDYCSAVVELCKECDLALLECSVPDEQKIDGHLTPTLAARIAREAGCKKLVLTHLYPPCDEIDVVAVCKENFPGEVVKAEDLMLFTV